MSSRKVVTGNGFSDPDFLQVRCLSNLVRQFILYVFNAMHQEGCFLNKTPCKKRQQH